MKIIIDTIPHSQQRYPTCGDWQWLDGGEVLFIRVSKLSDWRYEILIAIHELIETVLCKNDGDVESDVDAFDIAYEKQRAPGDESEPGDSPRAPYRRQHLIATGIEKILAAELGVDWKAYDKEVVNL